MATRAQAASKQTATLDFIEVSLGRVEFFVLGESPLIFNAVSEKARRQLLLPSGRKTAAEKASVLKHVPIEEYRNSVYYARDPNCPTAIVGKSTWFKKSAMGAALDIPGAKKTQLGRLMNVLGDEVPVFGVPELMMAVVRSADMNRTPDIRTRAILPSWCAHLTIEYAEPMLTGATIAKLLAAAGILQSVGDWRVEKGSGNYGRLSVVERDHPRVRVLMDAGGREAQKEALLNPVSYDSETESLLDWYDCEVRRRGIKSLDPKPAQKSSPTKKVEK